MAYVPHRNSLPLREPYVGAACLLLNVALLVLLHGANFYDSDQGVILNGAWSLYNGKKLYLDFFEYVPPGGFYLVYATWLLTGPHYWAAQLTGILFLLLGAVGVQRIAGLIVRESGVNAPPWSVRITALLFCATSAAWPMINHNTFSIVVAVWACDFLLRALCRPSSRDNVMAGVLAGVTFAFLQHRGLAVVAAALITYFLLWLRGFQWRVVGDAMQFVLASLIVPALLLVVFTPGALYDSLYQFPAVNYWQVNRVDPTPLLAAFAAIAVFAWYLRKQQSDLILFLEVLQCLLLLSIVMRPDMSHVLAVIFPLLCLLPLVVARFVRTRPDSILNVSSAALWMTFGVFLVGAAARLVLFSGDAAPKMLAYVRDNCTSSPYLYAGPFMPGVYFETGKLNATRYSVLMTGLNTDAQFRDAAADLSRLAVPCAVVNYTMMEKFGYSRDNPVDRYLDEHYRVVFEVADFRVLKQNAGSQASGQ